MKTDLQTPARMTLLSDDLRQIFSGNHFAVRKAFYMEGQQARLEDQHAALLAENKRLRDALEAISATQDYDERDPLGVIQGRARAALSAPQSATHAALIDIAKTGAGL